MHIIPTEILREMVLATVPEPVIFMATQEEKNAVKYIKDKIKGMTREELEQWVDVIIEKDLI